MTSQSKKSKCITCNKEYDIDLKTRPFCSIRCSYVDLDNWLTEKYSIQHNYDDYKKDI